MRNFTNSILFESALDSIEETNTPLYSIASNLFNPTVKVVEDDCDTELGVLVPLADRSQGYIDLSTDTPVTRASLIQAANFGKTAVSVRASYACISSEGICRKCLLAARPRLTSVSVGDFVRLSPELLVATEGLETQVGDSTYNLSYAPEEYDALYVFDDGTLIDASTYTISGKVLTFNTPPGSVKPLLVKYFINTNIAYFYWLSKTYSSSLLGLKPMFDLPLPLKPSLIRALVNEDGIKELHTALLNSSIATEDFVTYIPSIKDSLERAIYVILLASVFLARF